VTRGGGQNPGEDKESPNFASQKKREPQETEMGPQLAKGDKNGSIEGEHEPWGKILKKKNSES